MMILCQGREYSTTPYINTVYTSIFHHFTMTHVRGNILTTTNVDAICHQVNCLTTKPHGLSLQIARAHPWADIYSHRRPVGRRNLATRDTRGYPGTIRIFEKKDHPAVICFQSQWDYGKCGRRRQRHIRPYSDTRGNRQKWFRHCLNELGATHFKNIAFPWKIGCGLGGGDWDIYYDMILTFAQQYDKNVTFVIPK